MRRHGKKQHFLICCFTSLIFQNLELYSRKWEILQSIALLTHMTPLKFHHVTMAEKLLEGECSMYLHTSCGNLEIITLLAFFNTRIVHLVVFICLLFLFVFFLYFQAHLSQWVQPTANKMKTDHENIFLCWHPDVVACHTAIFTLADVFVKIDDLSYARDSSSKCNSTKTIGAWILAFCTLVDINDIWSSLNFRYFLTLGLTTRWCLCI